MSRERGEGPGSWIEPLYPRGDVRAGDLTELRIDIGAEWDEKGRLEVRAGDRTLYSADFNPENLSTVAAIPEAVKSLRPGDRFEWGFYPEKGEPTVARCTVVADAPRVAAMEADLKEQDPSLRRRLVALALLEEGLFCAAYREAAGLVGTGKADEELLAIMQRALAGMDLEDSTLWADMRDRADRLGD
jgi:hypothetical protein